MSIALLIVDVQKEFVENKLYRDKILFATQYINEVSRYFREAKLPVVIVNDLSAGGGPNSEGFKVADEVITDESDIQIHKSKENAFWETDLEQILRDKQVEHVIVSGFAVPYCVLSTYLGAKERGFGVSFLQNGIAGIEKEQVKQLQYERDVINYKALRFLISKIKVR